MLTLILLCGAAIAAFLLYRRFQRGAYLAGGVFRAPAPVPVRAAAKRLSYQPRANVHSIVSVNSAELCVTAMATAFAQMDDLAPPPPDIITASVIKHFHPHPQQAADITLLAVWLVEQGGGPTPAFERLTKRLKQLDHGPYFSKMMNVIGDVKAAGAKGMASAPQADAMGALARILRTA
jgi:hypothetical protein